MKVPDDRWKPTSSGLLLPEDFQFGMDERLDEVILRLPCFEPSGMELTLRVRDLLRHIAIIGSSGSGKTTLLNRIWSDLISYRSNQTGCPAGLLILDCQGGHAVEHVRYLAEKSGRAGDVLVLSKTEGYLDPMSVLRDFASLDVAASKLISATSFYGGNDQDIYWSENASALLSSILTLLLVIEEKVTIWRVIDAISDFYLQPTWSEKAERRLKEFQSIVSRAQPHLSSGVKARIKFALQTFQGWGKLDLRTKSILTSCINITIAPFMAASALPYWDVSKGTRIEPAAALDGKIVVVSVPGASEPETAGLLCRLIKIEFYREAQRRRSFGSNKIAGFIMDEFHLAVTCGSARWADATHLATLRGKGVFIIAATQGLSQLDQAIGHTPTDTLITNFSSLIFMRSQEMGRLYSLAERVFGHRPNQIVSGPSFDASRDLIIPPIPWWLPPELVCPPGALAQLDTHQSYVLLANGFRTEAPVWLAPLYLPEPQTTEVLKSDVDMLALRRAGGGAGNRTTTVASETIYYSSGLWGFFVNTAPRQAKAIDLVTLGEFRLALRGLGHNPVGVEQIPPAWRMACFHLARRLARSVRLCTLAAKDGQLEVAFLGLSNTVTLSDLLHLERRWKRSVYPTVLRPLHVSDRLWLETHYPHLCAEMDTPEKMKRAPVL